jgi:hypothetical protein
MSLSMGVKHAGLMTALPERQRVRPAPERSEWYRPHNDGMCELERQAKTATWPGGLSRIDFAHLALKYKHFKELLTANKLKLVTMTKPDILERKIRRSPLARSAVPCTELLIEVAIKQDINYEMPILRQ